RSALQPESANGAIDSRETNAERPGSRVGDTDWSQGRCIIASLHAPQPVCIALHCMQCMQCMQRGATMQRPQPSMGTHYAVIPCHPRVDHLEPARRKRTSFAMSH